MGNGSLVFFGTPQLCLPFLDVLKTRFDLRLIITQPDSFGGRKKQAIIPAVKSFALSNNIPYLQPVKLRDPGLAEKIRSYKPEIGVVISYGKIIPASIFSIPKFNTVNVHFSLLPEYRGAAPVQRAIENGDGKTGITIFEIDKKMDTGPVYDQQDFEIGEHETSADLLDRLCQDGAGFLADTLEKIISRSFKKIPQQESRATYAPPVHKSEGIVDWSMPARQIYNRFRAFTPWPGVSFCYNSISFKLTNIRVAGTRHNIDPGEVISLDKNGLKVGCGQDSALEIIEFQPECKKSMTPYCYSLGNNLSGPFE